MATARKTADKNDKADNDGIVDDAAALDTFEKPKATIKAEEQAAERADEVREIQKEAYLNGRTNVPGQAVETAYGLAPEKGDPDSVSFSLDGSSVTMVVTSNEIQFSREDWLSVVRKVNSLSASL